MLYSQTLLRRSASLAAPLRASRTATPTISRGQLGCRPYCSHHFSASTAGHALCRRQHSPNSLLNARSFSVSTARRKEKPSSDDKPPLVEEEEGKKSETSEVKEPEGEAKNETNIPDPIPQASAAESKAGAVGAGASSTGGETGSSGDSGSRRRRSTQEKALSKPSIPDVYPQVMAIPITQRPLFPGFYKMITIRDPAVASAIQELYKRGQPYVGVFLFKDDAADKDKIDSLDDVYDVGTFCQITSAFPAQGDKGGLSAVLYPHRRIRLTSLISNKAGAEEPVAKAEVEIAEKPPAEAPKDTAPAPEKKGDVVASFEETAETKDKASQEYSHVSFLREHDVSLVKVDNMTEGAYDRKDPTIQALINEVISVIKEIATMNPLFRDQISTFSMAQNAGNIMDDPAKLADFAAAVSQGEPSELQDTLSSMNIEERLYKGLLVLKKELMNAQLQSKISKDVESKIQKRQREYYLLEQKKGIERELGLASDGKDKLIEKFKEKADKLAMPEAVKKVFEEELQKLGALEPAASEFNVTRNYLDWLTQIPWGQRSAETFGINNAMKILDEDHHGLKDVKDRILEFIAVGKLRGTVEGKILCMVGPPGVGKTSIGKSIARALNREYYRFSVGGLTDVAEIKGHRRTYVGALPGRIIQALKKCQTENPLILIDEVDKIGRGYRGDPSSALLELLDPEQNSSFLDHYMDVPVDLSKVLFVCTANMTDTIPRPLLDRMEMIELSGYVADEKMAIAERYLAPQAKEASGLKDANVDLQQDAIQELINKYARESGVRNLKKHIEKVYRKAALRIVKEHGDEVLSEDKALTEEGKAAQASAAKDTSEVTDTSPSISSQTTETPRVALQVPSSVNITISKSDLKDYVGPPIFIADRLYESTPPGVAMGLAWTSMGGAALYVESILEAALSADSRAHFSTTGNLQPVMKESTSIAYAFARSMLARQYPANKFFEHARIHMHCPEGAVQKDGPSAGITMASSLLSLALDRELEPTIAMTGELTVTGKVLRIGGLREKTVAARRAGAKTIIFPEDNMSDWLELPENIKEGIEGKPVAWYKDVFNIVFPNLDSSTANKLWKDELSSKKKKKSKGKEEDSGDEDEDDSKRERERDRDREDEERRERRDGYE